MDRAGLFAGAALSLHTLSERIVREGEVVEITSFGNCCIAADTGDLFRVEAAALPADNPEIGQRLQFHIDRAGRLCHIELIF